MKVFKVYSYLFLIIIALNLHSCEFNSFFYGEEVTISIDNERIVSTNLSELNFPMDIVSGGIMLIGDDLILANSGTEDSVMLNVYDLNSGLYKAGLMPQGRGVGEFIYVYPLGQQFVENEHYKEFYTGPYYDSLYCLNYTESISKGETVIDKVISKR